MKNRKLLFISVAVMLVLVFAGCASMQLVSVEQDTVSGPDRVRQGQDINPREITVWGEYKDGKRKVVSINRNNIIFNKGTPGHQTVRVRVSNQEVSFQTEVMALRSLRIASQPKITLFKMGEDPDPKWPGLEIRGEWDQMGSHIVELSSCTLTGFLKDQAGRQTIKVAYEGLTTTFDIDVRALASLQITQTPTKIDYFQDEPLNLTGLKVMGVWDGFPSEQLAITMDDITGYNPYNVGIQHVTVTKNGKSANFDVEVLALTSIEIEKPPTKTDYKEGEPLDLKGIIVMGNYTGANPAKKKTELIAIERLAVDGYEPDRIGNQQRVRITVKSQQASFFVNITAAPASATPVAATVADPISSNRAFGKYPAAQVRDCQRNPRYPSSGATMTLSSFIAPLSDTLKTTISSANLNSAGAYFQLSQVAGSNTNLALNLYRADGTFLQEISKAGRIHMFFNEGFLYISTSADYGYVFMYNPITQASITVTSFNMP